MAVGVLPGVALTRIAPSPRPSARVVIGRVGRSGRVLAQHVAEQAPRAGLSTSPAFRRTRTRTPSTVPPLVLDPGEVERVRSARAAIHRAEQTGGHRRVDVDHSPGPPRAPASRNRAAESERRGSTRWIEGRAAARVEASVRVRRKAGDVERPALGLSRTCAPVRVRDRPTGRSRRGAEGLSAGERFRVSADARKGRHAHHAERIPGTRTGYWYRWTERPRECDDRSARRPRGSAHVPHSGSLIARNRPEIEIRRGIAGRGDYAPFQYWLYQVAATGHRSALLVDPGTRSRSGERVELVIIALE